MKQFKPGDHVRGAAGSQGYYTRPGELLGAVVTGLNPDGDVVIRVLNHTKYDAEKMSEFEVPVVEIELIEEEGSESP